MPIGILTTWRPSVYANLSRDDPLEYGTHCYRADQYAFEIAVREGE